MAGKNTTLHPDKFPSSGHVKPFKLSCSSIQYLNNDLGRDLTPEEITSLNSGMAIYRQMRALHYNGFPTNQDVKRTLKHISNLAPSEALAAFKTCDDFTLTLIEDALRSNHISYPYPHESIPGAAGLALKILQEEPTKNGRHQRGYQTLFADYCLKSWLRCGGTHMALSHNNANDKQSPLLSWSFTLFSELEGKRFDWRKIIELLKEAKR